MGTNEGWMRCSAGADARAVRVVDVPGHGRLRESAVRSVALTARALVYVMDGMQMDRIHECVVVGARLTKVA